MKRQSDRPHADGVRDHDRGRGLSCALLIPALALGLGAPLLLLQACQTPEAALTSPTSASDEGSGLRSTSKRESKAHKQSATRTANPDGRTFENQPDYDAEAASLREYVGPKLPSPIPSDGAAACEAMLAAADAFYSAIETTEPRNAEVQRSLAASRAEDLSSCIATTSPEAAACVTVLIARRTAELPWLIDQCSRAYPTPT